MSNILYHGNEEDKLEMIVTFLVVFVINQILTMCLNLHVVAYRSPEPLQ